MATTYFAVLLVIIAVGYIIAFTRKGKVASATLGSRRLEVHTRASPDVAFAKLAMLGRPYTVDDKDAASRILVIGAPVTFFTWGFLFPVHIHPAETGSRIDIGCHSKFIQLGPLVSSAHTKVVAAIEQALSLPEARVA